MDILAEAAHGGLRWGRADGLLVPAREVVYEALEWVGTPFLHQQEIKGVGADCGGLVRGVSLALGLLPENYRDMMPADLRGYARQSKGGLGRKLCDYYWNEISMLDIGPGCVGLFVWGVSEPQHCAIIGQHPIAGQLSLIHSLGPRPPNRVVHQILDSAWRSRMVAAYALPGVSY